MCYDADCFVSDGLNTYLQNYSVKPSVDFYTVHEGVWERHKADRTDCYRELSVQNTRGLIPMGIELEVEHNYDAYEQSVEDAIYEAITEMHRKLPCEAKSYDKHSQLVIAKYDGSLDDGAEFVSQPMTIAAHKAFNWSALRGKGFFAWEASTCGIHVHVPKSFFTNKQLWIFLKLHQSFITEANNRELLRWIAGRGHAHYAKWEMPFYDSVEPSRSLLAVACSRYSSGTDRYTMINLANKYSIELRYFQGNINIDGIMSRLEFIQAMYDFSVVVSGLPHRNIAKISEDWVQHFVQFVYANGAEYPLFEKKLLATVRWGAGSGFLDLHKTVSELITAGKGR